MDSKLSLRMTYQRNVISHKSINNKVARGEAIYLKTSNQKKLDLGFRRHQCNWGVHICGLYAIEKEQDEIIRGFFPSSGS